jgi:hypothetical protein
MKPELEAILKAYDAARQAVRADKKRLLAIYDSEIERILEQYPGLSRSTLEKTIRLFACRSRSGVEGLRNYQEAGSNESCV